MTYETMRELAGTFGALYFVLLFAGVLVYALHPKSKEKFERAAHIPLREDDLDD